MTAPSMRDRNGVYKCSIDALLYSVLSFFKASAFSILTPQINLLLTMFNCLHSNTNDVMKYEHNALEVGDTEMLLF